MSQVYLLSVLVNIVAGLVLSGDFLGERLPALSFLNSLRTLKTARSTLGILAILVGIGKLFLLAPGETVPVAGDLLPALAGLALGGLFFAERLPGGSGDGEAAGGRVATVLKYRIPIGLAGAAVGLLHFIFPHVVIF